jgi:hypothetical protein
MMTKRARLHEEPVHDLPLWKSLNPLMEPSCNNLGSDLFDKRVQWPGGIHQYFLPVDVQDELLTGPNIIKELQDLFKPRPKEEIFSLAVRICGTARKLFAILLLRGKGASILPLVDTDGVSDRDLPLIKEDHGRGFKLGTGKRLTAFANWMPQDIEDFDREQWCLLAPVFKHQGEHKELEECCVLPFTADFSNVKGGRGGSGGSDGPGLISCGGYSEVWCVRIHPSHQKFLKSSNPEV